MSHVFRFLGEQVDARTWRLAEDEAHHLRKVLRIGLGALVEVTDGRGTWATGTVEAMGSRDVTVAAAEAQREPEPRVRLAMAVGALRPGDADEVMPAMVELGIDTVHVFLQEASAKGRLTPSVVERWERILKAAMKQSKRARLTRLEVHGSLGELLAAIALPGAAAPAELRLVLDGQAAWTLPAALVRAVQRPVGVLALAGGEKGLSSAESAMLETAGFTPARLGPYVLRAVTAVVAAATVLALYREDLAGATVPSGIPTC